MEPGSYATAYSEDKGNGIRGFHVHYEIAAYFVTITVLLFQQYTHYTTHKTKATVGGVRGVSVVESDAPMLVPLTPR